MNNTFVYQDVTYEIHLHPLAHIIDTTTGHKPDSYEDILIDYLNTQGYIIPDGYNKHHAVKLINKIINNLPLDEEEQGFKQVVAPNTTNADETTITTDATEAPLTTDANTSDVDDLDENEVENENCENPAPAPAVDKLIAPVIEDPTEPSDLGLEQEIAPIEADNVPAEETPEE